jgi:hypothetical protein
MPLRRINSPTYLSRGLGRGRTEDSVPKYGIPYLSYCGDSLFWPQKAGAGQALKHTCDDGNALRWALQKNRLSFSSLPFLGR